MRAGKSGKGKDKGGPKDRWRRRVQGPGSPGGPSLSDREVARALEGYNLGRLQFTRPAGGTASPAVVAVTDQGEFLLKRRNPRYCTPGQLAFDHAVIHHLHQAGLPVTPPTRTFSGSRWFQLEGHVYEVYVLVRGAEHESGNLAQIRAAGEMLGRLHLATTGFDPGDGKRPRRLHDPTESRAGFWGAARLAQRQGRPAADYDTLQRLIRVTETLARSLSDKAYWALPGCIIHGDWHPGNLKFAGDAVSGIFDFDWVMAGPRAVDVADGLLYFAGRRPQPLEPRDIRSLTQPLVLEREWMVAFGAGYAEHVRLTVSELMVLPLLMRSRWLFSRADAAQRKLPESERVAYLLDGTESMLGQISVVEDFLTAGTWAHSAAGENP